MILVTAFLAVAMLATPLVSAMQIGQGQTKLDFEIYLDGMIIAGPPEESKSSDGINHLKGLPTEPTGDYYVVVDGVNYYPIDYLSSGDLATNKVAHAALHIEESIIFEDGTLELQIQDHAPIPYTGTFIGFGTGSLEGVKVQGTTIGDGTTFTRTGTVMGWPATP